MQNIFSLLVCGNAIGTLFDSFLFILHQSVPKTNYPSYVHINNNDRLILHLLFNAFIKTLFGRFLNVTDIKWTMKQGCLLLLTGNLYFLVISFIRSITLVSSNLTLQGLDQQTSYLINIRAVLDGKSGPWKQQDFLIKTKGKNNVNRNAFFLIQGVESRLDSTQNIFVC